MTSRIVFGILLTAVQVALLLPLLRHAARTRDITGISPLGEAVWVAGGLGWAAYGVMSGSDILIVSGSVAALGSAAVLAFTRSSVARAVMTRSVSASLAVAAGIAASTAVWGLVGLSASLAVFGVFQFLPQIIESTRRILGRMPSPGVSAYAAALRGGTPRAGPRTPSRGRCTAWVATTRR